MPYVIGPRRVRKLAAAVFSTALLLGVVPVAADAACPSSAGSDVFAEYNDTASYVLVQGGNFEAGAPGWSLSKAAVVEEEASPSGAALVIQPGGTAVSPAFCVSSEYPTFRFLVHKISGYGALNVSLRWTDPFGFSHSASVASIQSAGSWSISPVLNLATDLPLWMPGSTLSVELVFEAGQGSFLGRHRSAGEWAIDDVYVDPHSR
jgi:hypothetical protein